MNEISSYLVVVFALLKSELNCVSNETFVNSNFVLSRKNRKISSSLNQENILHVHFDEKSEALIKSHLNSLCSCDPEMKSLIVHIDERNEK
jgi:hypothetical protein